MVVDQLTVKSLSLDLNNFRVVKAKSEISEIRALITISPDRFWALMRSLLDDGYHATENIIVQKQGTVKVVKEGNRRIAALKIILGYTAIKKNELPSDINEYISKITNDWKSENNKVPCVVYSSSETEVVDKIVSLTHGKGEGASRDKWLSIATARHNREQNGHRESGLDVLEIFLKKSNKITNDQKIRWGGDYPLSVLDESLRKMFPLLGLVTVEEMADKYPKIKHLTRVENIILGIGLKNIRFQDIRLENYFYTVLGIDVPKSDNTEGTSKKGNIKSKSSGQTGVKGSGTSKKPVSYSSNDPKAVRAVLKKFKPMGSGREKLVALLNESKMLDVKKYPHAFCFLLRSMFEISAKIYSKENGIKYQKDGKDKTLATLLRDVTKHLTNGQKDKEMVKVLHGAMTEIAKPNSLLSVTSLNQLVHNPKFSIIPSDICILFCNIFPLLEEMNN